MKSGIDIDSEIGLDKLRSDVDNAIDDLRGELFENEIKSVNILAVVYGISESKEIIFRVLKERDIVYLRINDKFGITTNNTLIGKVSKIILDERKFNIALDDYRKEYLMEYLNTTRGKEVLLNKLPDGFSSMDSSMRLNYKLGPDTTTTTVDSITSVNVLNVNSISDEILITTLPKPLKFIIESEYTDNLSHEPIAINKLLSTRLDVNSDGEVTLDVNNDGEVTRFEAEDFVVDLNNSINNKIPIESETVEILNNLEIMNAEYIPEKMNVDVVTSIVNGAQIQILQSLNGESLFMDIPAVNANRLASLSYDVECITQNVKLVPNFLDVKLKALRKDLKTQKAFIDGLFSVDGTQNARFPAAILLGCNVRIQDPVKKIEIISKQIQDVLMITKSNTQPFYRLVMKRDLFEKARIGSYKGDMYLHYYYGSMRAFNKFLSNQIDIPLTMTLNYSKRMLQIHGHRGARGARPENTISAFRYAMDNGVEFLELDLQMTKDNKIIICHDRDINESICNGVSKPIKTLTLKEIKEYDCGSKMNINFPNQQTAPNEKIPSFIELISLIKSSEYKNKQVVMNIEIKTLSKNMYDELASVGITVNPLNIDTDDEVYKFSKQLIDTLKEYEIVNNTVIIQSFDPRALKCVNTIDSSIKTSYLIYYIKSLDELITKSKQLGVKIISPIYEVINKDTVKKLQNNYLEVLPWTVNDVDVFKRLVEYGVDGIITDYPKEMKEILMKGWK